MFKPVFSASEFCGSRIRIPNRFRNTYLLSNAMLSLLHSDMYSLVRLVAMAFA